MSANGQINWDSVAPRANTGAAAGGVNWDTVAPKANPTQTRPDTSGSMALDFMQGGGAELIGTALGAYNLLRKIPGADKVLPPVSPEVQQYAEPPHTVSAKIGGLLTGLAEFAIPGGEVGTATKGAGLAAQALAQGATAGGVEAVRTGGNLPATADVAALGAAGPVAGAALGAAAPIAGRALRAAPGLAADVVGFVNPRLGNLARIGIRAAKAAAAGAEEAAPAAKAAAPAVDTEEQQLLDAIQRGQSRDIAAENAPQPKPARGLAHYGVQPAAEVPPEPPPSAPAPAPAPAAAPATPPVARPAPVVPSPVATPPPAAPPAAKVQPIRPEPVKPAAPPAEAEDIDFQQRYGEQEQPEVAKFFGHEQPAPPQPKPASGATAAKSARYADAIAAWAKDMGMSPKAIADQWGTTTPEVRGQIILQLKQKGYVGANETIPRTSAQGIVDALKAKAATIKPPSGFGMGSMKQYPAPEPITAPPASPAPSALTEPPTAAAEQSTRPSLGDTGRDIYQGWKSLAEGSQPPRAVIEGFVPGVGRFDFRNGKIVRLFKQAGRTGTLSTYEPASNADIAAIHDAIDKGQFQVEQRTISGAGGVRKFEGAGALEKVFHQATGKPLQEFLETPEGAAWWKRMNQ